MKRQGNLIEEIADFDNLQWAFCKAKRGKEEKNEVIRFQHKLWDNLRSLQKQVLTSEIETENYRYFTIYDPKKRLICAVPFAQRVLHHALMNVCHRFFDRVQIYDSYASRLGKGTYAALDRARKFQKRHCWFLKLDFVKYFDSLDHLILKDQLNRMFKDKRLLAIFEKIIDSHYSEKNRGVPIGNLTSQYFANHYLSDLDHFVKEKLKIPAYVRYMDDIILWHDQKAILLNAGLSLKKYSEQKLDLTLKPFCLNKNIQGLPFLGYLLYPDDIRLAHRSRIRFIKKLRIYENNLKYGIWTQEEYQNHISPLIAFTEFANSKAYRKKIIFNK